MTNSLDVQSLSWNDLTVEQAMTVNAFLSQDSLFLEDEGLAAKKLLITQYLLHIDDAFLEKWEKDAGTDVFIEEMQQVVDEVTRQFVEKRDDGHYQIVLGLTKNPYPQIGDLYGPGDALENISLIELATLFTLLENFLETQEEDIAYRIIATAYRPKKDDTLENIRSNYEGDIRLPYHRHESTVEGRIEQIKTLPPQVSGLILFFITSSWHHIIHSYPLVFSARNKKAASKFGWASIILGLADGLQNLDTISKESASNALIYLSYIQDTRK